MELTRGSSQFEIALLSWCVSILSSSTRYEVSGILIAITYTKVHYQHQHQPSIPVFFRKSNEDGKARERKAEAGMNVCYSIILASETSFSRRCEQHNSTHHLDCVHEIKHNAASGDRTYPNFNRTQRQRPAGNRRTQTQINIVAFLPP